MAGPVVGLKVAGLVVGLKVAGLVVLTVSGSSVATGGVVVEASKPNQFVAMPATPTAKEQNNNRSRTTITTPRPPMSRHIHFFSQEQVTTVMVLITARFLMKLTEDQFDPDIGTIIEVSKAYTHNLLGCHLVVLGVCREHACAQPVYVCWLLKPSWLNTAPDHCGTRSFLWIRVEGACGTWPSYRRVWVDQPDGSVSIGNTDDAANPWSNSPDLAKILCG